MPRTTLAIVLWGILALRASGEQLLQSALPSDWIALVDVAHPTETMEQLAPVLEALNFQPPGELNGYLSLIANLDGLDESGQFVAGLVQSSEGRLQPFVLLPVTDHNALIESFDGDPQVDQPVLNFGGQRILAIRQEGWLALCSEDIGDKFTATDASPPLPLTGASATVAVRPAAWRQAFTIGNQIKQSDRHWYSRVRRVSMGGNWIPRSRAGVSDLLLTALPVVEQLAEEEVAVTWAFDLSDQAINCTLQLSTAKSTKGESDEEHHAATTQLLDHPDPVVSVVGTIPEIWRRQVTEGILRWQMSISEESILQRGRSRYYERFIEACTEIAAQSQSIEAVTAVPAADLPPMANQAAVIACRDSARLVDLIEQAFDIWNQIATIEMRQSKLIFEKSDVEIEGIVATRYAADLQAAFLAGDVPEVRTMMIKLFGLPGDLVYTVVPLDNQHVLVSQWRAAQTAALVGDWSTVASRSNQFQPLRLEFSPRNFHRWKAQQYAIEFADQPHAPKVELIDNVGVVEATVQGDSQQVEISLSVPGDLVGQWLEAPDEDE